MKILILGDIVGSKTIEYLREKLNQYITDNKVDYCIANGENTSEINGISEKDAIELYKTGVDFITLGNHAFGKKDLYQFLDEEPNIIRPANFPPENPGTGYKIVDINGYKALIINILGVVYLTPLANPFFTVDKILKREEGNYDFSILDIHAEATSEKIAIAKYFDGKINIIFGTHTHVETADEQILKGGSAYITDIGMSGPIDSILGVKSEYIIERMITQMPQKFAVAEGEIKIKGILVDITPNSKKINSISRIVF